MRPTVERPLPGSLTVRGSPTQSAGLQDVPSRIRGGRASPGLNSSSQAGKRPRRGGPTTPRRLVQPRISPRGTGRRPDQAHQAEAASRCGPTEGPERSPRQRRATGTRRPPRRPMGAPAPRPQTCRSSQARNPATTRGGHQADSRRSPSSSTPHRSSPPLRTGSQGASGPGAASGPGSAAVSGGQRPSEVRSTLGKMAVSAHLTDPVAGPQFDRPTPQSTPGVLGSRVQPPETP